MLIDVSFPVFWCDVCQNNYGRQDSNGIEFSAWGKIIQNRDWMWSLSVNGLHSKTTIREISDALKRKNDENGAKTKIPLLVCNFVRMSHRLLFMLFVRPV